jgi:hypothetical protein
MRDRFRRLRVGLKMIRVAGRKGFASHGPVDSFRFGVGNPSGRRSSAYTIFRNGTDVYLTPYGTRHILKVSLHASGDWRVAITKEHLTRRDAVPIASARNRTLLSWRRPYEVADGYLNAFSIHIPGAELRKLGAPPNKQKDIRWHPDPGDDRVVTFLIVFLPPWELADWWPGFGDKDKSPVGWMRLDNGDAVWVIAQERSIYEFDRQVIDSLHADWANTPIPVDIDDYRSMAFGQMPGDSMRMMYECAAVSATVQPTMKGVKGDHVGWRINQGPGWIEVSSVHLDDFDEAEGDESGRP